MVRKFFKVTWHYFFGLFVGALVAATIMLAAGCERRNATGPHVREQDGQRVQQVAERQVDMTAIMRAIHMVESGGRKTNVPNGDGSRAIGPFQIHRVYWIDAVEHDRRTNGLFGISGGTYEDCRDYNYAYRVVMSYMHRYAKRAIDAGDWETIARIHNGGPGGAKRAATLKYWERVKKFL